MKILAIGIILLACSPGALGQVFPGVVAGNRDLYVAVGGVATTITAAVTATSTTFPVASVANMQPFELLVIDNEIVEMCSFTPSPLAITIGKNSCPGADGRGIGGTSASSHASGARIADFITGEHHNAGRKEIEAIEGALGANLSNIPGTANGNPVPLTKGGTGATSQSGALAAIYGVTPLLANGLCFSQVTGPASCITPGTAGTVLTSVGPANLPVWQPGGGGGGNVSSVFGRTGTVAAQAGDYTAALVTNAVDQTVMYTNPAWITSLPWTKVTGAPPFITNPMISAGDFIVGGTGGTPTRLATPGTGTFCPNWTTGGSTVTWVTCPGGGGSSGITSIGITMPSGFNVSGSPLTTNGVIAITGAGNATQYVNGLGQLTTFPTFVTSIFSRTGAVTAQAGDYTTAQVTEMTNLYFTTARVYASLSGTSPIVFNASTGNISCPTCGTGGGGAVTSVFGRTGVVVAASGDYNATQVTNAENTMNKDVNGGYVGRSAAGNATIPGTWTGIGFASSDATHTSLMMLIPGLNTNFASPIATGDWGLFLDSSNSNKLTRQDSMGNKIVIEGAPGSGGSPPYTQGFTTQTSVSLTHNLNLTPITAFNIDCFDTTNALIFPSSTTATSANAVTVTFAVATSGSCTVVSGGGAGGGSSVGAVNHVQTSNGAGAFLDGGCTMVSSVLTCGPNLLLSGAETALASVTTPTIRIDSTTHNMELTKAGDATADFVGVAPQASATAGSYVANITADGVQHLAPLVSSSIFTTSPAADPGGWSVYEFNNSTGAMTFNLPAGVAGMQRCYRNSTTRTGVITVAVTTGNQIDLNGTNGTATTGTLVSSGVAGDSVCLASDAANHWMAYVQRGAWVNN